MITNHRRNEDEHMNGKNTPICKIHPEFFVLVVKFIKGLLFTLSLFCPQGLLSVVSPNSIVNSNVRSLKLRSQPDLRLFIVRKCFLDVTCAAFF